MLSSLLVDNQALVLHMKDRMGPGRFDVSLCGAGRPILRFPSELP